MKIHEHDFENQDIVLDFHEFSQCSFNNCKMIFNGLGAFTLTTCKVSGNCTWHFQSSAQLTLQTMAQIYSNGGLAKDLVEQMISRIRNQG